VTTFKEALEALKPGIKALQEACNDGTEIRRAVISFTSQKQLPRIIVTAENAPIHCNQRDAIKVADGRGYCFVCGESFPILETPPAARG
jgi:hypothetical protein